MLIKSTCSLKSKGLLCINKLLRLISMVHGKDCLHLIKIDPDWFIKSARAINISFTDTIFFVL